MKSYMFSVLAARARPLDFKAFTQELSYDWLVWEPGPWVPPPKRPETMVVLPTPTRLKAGGESLVFTLKGGSSEKAIALGRDAGADIHINDATLSRTHLVFMPTTGGEWTVRDAGSSNGSWVDDQRLATGQPCILANGMRIRAGQVYLTFHDPPGLFDRLKAAG